MFGTGVDQWNRLETERNNRPLYIYEQQPMLRKENPRMKREKRKENG